MLDQLSLWMLKMRLPGADRLWNFGSHRDASRFGETRTRFGTRALVHPGDYVDRFLILHGSYEAEVTLALLAVAEYPTDVFWDVGAHSGLHAIVLRLHGKVTESWCFEPNPAMIGRIDANSRLNNVPIRIAGLALDSSDGFSRFHVCHSNSGRSGLIAWGDEDNYQTTLCARASGDGLVDKDLIIAPNLMKIDVEGNEFNVLQGCRTLLGSPSFRGLVIESGPEILDHDNPMNQLLTSAGLSILGSLNRMEPTDHNLSNFVAVRKSALSASAVLELEALLDPAPDASH